MENSTQFVSKTQTERALLRKYYMENDFFLSVEGILKVVSIAACAVLGVAQLWGGWCGAGRGAGAGAALAAGGAVLGGAALLTALAAVWAVLLAARAPLVFFITDMVVSTVIGVGLLLVAILSVSLCEVRRVIDYVYGPLALINSMLLISSAVVTYTAVSKKWDALLGMRNNQRSPDTNDLEV